jgi:hypothetical protein
VFYVVGLLNMCSIFVVICWLKPWQFPPKKYVVVYNKYEIIMSSSIETKFTHWIEVRKWIHMCSLKLLGYFQFCFSSHQTYTIIHFNYSALTLFIVLITLELSVFFV